MADEALSCFTSLLASIPGWIADLEKILKSASERQHEFLSADLTSSSVAAPKRRRSKSSSMNSKRSVDRQSVKEGSNLEHHQTHIVNRDILRIASRKRKTPSEMSGDQSGPPKVRSRQAGPIYYDGAVQKSFEQLVRGVGASRNALRKGKLSAKVDALSHAGFSSSDGGSESDECSPMTANLQFKSARRTTKPGNTFIRDEGFANFDRIDGRLEKAQALCERAAHQILRDGSCIQEVTGAKEHFVEALTMAQSEIPPLRRRIEKAAEKRRRDEERKKVDEEIEEKMRMSETSDNSKDVEDIILTSFTTDGNLEVDELEVDDDQDNDSDDGMPEFNINAIPLGKFTPYRNVRMSARACC